MNKKNYLFKQLDEFSIRKYDTDEEIFIELDKIFDTLKMLNIKEISDEEAWILLNFTNRTPENYLDGYMGEYDWLIEEALPSWPLNDDLLLLEPHQTGIFQFKISSLEVGGELLNPSIAFNRKTNISLSIENYWNEINWKNIVLPEIRLIFLILYIRTLENEGSDDRFMVNSEIKERIFKLLENTILFTEEKVGLNVLLEPNEQVPLY